MSSSVPTVAGLCSEKYLQKRTRNLNRFENMFLMIIDEIYIAQIVEFSGGSIKGMLDNQVPKTVLCFIIKSIASKFREVIAMYPGNRVVEDLFMISI